MSKAKKKVDRAPTKSGKARDMCSGRVDADILNHAKKECKRIYKVGISTKLEDILIEKFGVPKK